MTTSCCNLSNKFLGSRLSMNLIMWIMKLSWNVSCNCSSSSKMLKLSVIWSLGKGRLLLSVKNCS